MNNNNELGKTIADVFRDKYVIPLYQRNFAWRTDEIQQLLQDVYAAKEANPNGNYYLGSLVVMQRHNGDFEVIDGQQRLTVLSLIAAIIGELRRPVLSYDSRPEVQEFFDLLCNGNLNQALSLSAPSLFYLKEACEFLQNAKVMQPSNGDEENTSDFKSLDLKSIAGFLMRHVVLVCNELPEDTDVATYFEIMNNRGEQLQKHEIVKARLIENIKCGADPTVYDTNRQHLFAKIWDACSQMDIPIQRLFSAEDRRTFFGEKYDGFSSKFIHDSDAKADTDKEFSLEEIIKGNSYVNDAINNIGELGTETDIYTYSSIIDFPNFLMHVLKLYLNAHKQESDIPLNEKELLSVYSAFSDKIDSMEFIELLLFCRTVFDRFIVKTVDDSSDSEDGRKWILLKPTKYSDSWKYTLSFDGFPGEQIQKALSMLQVTFRQRIYKNWLFKALEWFYGKCFQTGDLSSVTPEEYLAFLNGYMLDYFERQKYDIPAISDDTTPSPANSYSQGTNTPHFLLNFIDYLYWSNDHEKFHFTYKYWNSVEHHLARNKVNDGGAFIDNLGNLCLISKSANSRLSDRDVKEKVELCEKGNIGPNRKVIYDKTKSDLGKAKWAWGEKEIRDHYNDIVKLLEKRNEILVCP